MITTSSNTEVRYSRTKTTCDQNHIPEILSKSLTEAVIGRGATECTVAAKKKSNSEICNFRPQKLRFFGCKKFFYNEIPFSDLILLDLAQKLQSPMLRNKITWQ